VTQDMRTSFYTPHSRGSIFTTRFIIRLVFFSLVRDKSDELGVGVFRIPRGEVKNK